MYDLVEQEYCNIKHFIGYVKKSPYNLVIIYKGSGPACN